MRKMLQNCSKIVAGVLLASLMAACGSKEGEGTATSSTDPQVFYSHSVAISSDTSSVFSWGVNTYGQLGNDSTKTEKTPVEVDGMTTGMKGVSAGATHTLAFDGLDGELVGNVYAWGNNGFGQLGDNSTTARETPVKVRYVNGANPTALNGITAVAAGADHSLALDGDGVVWAWGSNNQGQLGLELTKHQQNFAVPVAIIPIGTIVMIAAGGAHSLTLDNGDRSVWSWGLNNFGQLGQGVDNQNKIATPGNVVKDDGTGKLTGVTHIAAGGSHSLFVSTGGGVWSCGANAFGQLGDGETEEESDVVPVLKTGGGQLTGAIAVAAGLDHSLAIIEDDSGSVPPKGTVWAWGNNDSGQLGNPKNANTSTPVEYPVQVMRDDDGHPLENVIKIVAIGNHSLALDSSNQLWAWGDNSYGQLGNDTTTNSEFAIKVKDNFDLYMPEPLP